MCYGRIKGLMGSRQRSPGRDSQQGTEVVDGLDLDLISSVEWSLEAVGLTSVAHKPCRDYR